MMQTLYGNILAALLLLVTSTPVWPGPSSVQTAPVAQATDRIVLSVDTAKSTVHWSLDSSLHTVHGTFRVKNGTLSIDPSGGKATGEIVVDAASGESGNDSRDRKMHNEVLETGRYAEVIFRPDRVDGSINTEGTSNLKLHGMFSLHGVDHEFIAPVQAQLKDGQWKGSSVFDLPFVEWGLKNPSNFMLKVKKVVSIQVELAGTLERPDR